MVEALGRTLYHFRPVKADGYNGATTFMRTVLTNCKLGQASKGWIVDTAGSTRSASAVMYWNFGHSEQTPQLDPLFREGDIIATHPALRKVKDARYILADVFSEVGDTQGDVPSDVEFTVQSVQEHTFKGKLHHYEVVLT